MIYGCYKTRIDIRFSMSKLKPSDKQQTKIKNSREKNNKKLVLLKKISNFKQFASIQLENWLGRKGLKYEDEWNEWKKAGCVSRYEAGKSLLFFRYFSEMKRCRLREKGILVEW